jgi:hypothetical protein
MRRGARRLHASSALRGAARDVCAASTHRCFDSPLSAADAAYVTLRALRHERLTPAQRARRRAPMMLILFIFTPRCRLMPLIFSRHYADAADFRHISPLDADFSPATLFASAAIIDVAADAASPFRATRDFRRFAAIAFAAAAADYAFSCRRHY